MRTADHHHRSGRGEVLSRADQQHPGRSRQTISLEREWRRLRDVSVDLRVWFPVDDAVLSKLHDRAFRTTPTQVHSWARQLECHSLTWVGAFEDGVLIGFIQLAWGGGAHAFLVDTVVDPGHQRRGVGCGLVGAAVAEATRAGCEWVHVDFEPHLASFCRDSCGFVSTDAGLLHLPTTPAGG